MAERLNSYRCAQSAQQGAILKSSICREGIFLERFGWILLERDSWREILGAILLEPLRCKWIRVAVVEWYTLRNCAQKRCLLTVNSYGKAVELRQLRRRARSLGNCLVKSGVCALWCLAHGKPPRERITSQTLQTLRKPFKANNRLALRRAARRTTWDHLKSTGLSDHKNFRVVRGAKRCCSAEEQHLFYFTDKGLDKRMPWNQSYHQNVERSTRKFPQSFHKKVELKKSTRKNPPESRWKKIPGCITLTTSCLPI